MFFLLSESTTTNIYTLSLHDALPIFLEETENPFLTDFYADRPGAALQAQLFYLLNRHRQQDALRQADLRSEEHTSELQSHVNLVCRLLLEKKKAAGWFCFHSCCHILC